MDPAASPIAPARAGRLLRFSLAASVTLAGAVFIVLVRFQHLSVGSPRDVGAVISIAALLAFRPSRLEGEGL